MRGIIFLFVVASFGFAPSIYSSRSGIRDSILVSDVVGTWRVSHIYHYPNRVRQNPAKSSVSHVTISSKKWEFKGSSNVIYDLRIDHWKNPGEFDLMHSGQKEPYGRGLLRREGRAIRVIYTWGNARPTGFENQAVGCELVLVRE
jgi:uncharacterized protein (TIGR03067 family)